MDLVARQREERKQRVLAEARRLIAKRGYEAITMRELAEKSLVSVPTLYNLFGGKNKILLAAVGSYFGNLLGEGKRVSTPTGLERVIGLAEALSRETPRHAAYARSLMSFFGNVSDAGGIHEIAATRLTAELRIGLEQMRGQRQLAAWVDPGALAARLASLLSIITFEWARNRFSDAGLRGAMLYGVGAMLLGLARGKAAAELEQIVREHQAGASEVSPADDLAEADEGEP